MSDILISLKLRRRSGVLASCVAALGRCGLEFRSQKLVDADGPCLELAAEGELLDSAAVLEAYAEVRGVSEVLDVLVDGQSLLHQPDPVEPPAEEESAEPEDDPAAPAQPVAAVAEDFQDQTGSVSSATPVEAPEQTASPPVAAASAAPAEMNQDDGQDMEPAADDDNPPDSEDERRRRMRAIMRRRRRYY